MVHDETVSSLPEGTILQHRYRLVRPLGEGGMGTSYLARDLVRDAEVTLKLLRRESPALLAALKDEFTRLRGLLHPHLCRVIDFGATRAPDGAQLAFYTADYVDGTTLDVFAKGRRFEAIAIPLGHALAALGFLHGLGIRHGDVKPENILVDARGSGVLIDLGCSRPMDDPRSGVLAGTPGFLAPELTRGDAADGRADLYALGVTLRRLAESTVDAPGSALRLADRLCRSAPKERPGDVAEVLEALDLAAAPASLPVAGPTRLIGRRAEIERVHAALARARDGVAGPRALLVVGPEGVGRTRLLQELKWEAELDGEVVEGDARQSFAVTSMLRRAVGDPDLPGGLAGLFAARARLAARATPIVLLLDDADALEASERALWIALLRSVEATDPVVVVASESGPAPVLHEAISVLSLAPLDASEVRAFTAGAIAAARGPQVMRLTGGVPAAIQGLLALVSCGDVGDDELDALAARGVISERRLASFARLGADERRLLAVIAAEGGAIDRGLAEALDPGAESQGKLVQRGWLSPGAAGPRLARMGEAQAILDATPADLRAALHAAAADRIQARLPALEGARASAAAARRVRHLVLAERLVDAEAAIDAGAGLAEAHPDAWGDAARALESVGSSLKMRLFAARVHEASGRSAEALSLLARLLRSRPDEATRGAIRLQAAAAHLKGGDAHRAERRLARVLATSSDAATRGRALDLRSRAQSRRGLWAEAMESATEGLALPVSPDIRADLHDDRGVAASYLGDLATAHRELDRAASLHAEGARPRAEARSASYRALAAYRAGDAIAAARGFRRALAIAEASGATDLLGNAALNLGTASHQTGDLGEALASYDQGLRIAIALGKSSTEATLRANLAKLFADVGAVDRAEPAARRAEERAAALGMIPIAAAARAVAGEVAQQRGRSAEALAALAWARARFVESGEAREVAEIDLQLAEIELARGGSAEGETHLVSAEGAIAALGAADLRARALLLRGRFRIDAGRWSEGLEDLEAAAELGREAGQRLLSAEIEARLADACRAKGAEVRARRHADAACELWERAAATLPPHLVDTFWAHPLRAGRREAPVVIAPGDAPSRERKLKRLLDINKKLSASLETAQILAWTVDSAIELTAAERGFVLLAASTDEGDGVSIAVARNLDPSASGEAEMAFSRSIAERVIASGEPVVTIDAQGDQRFSRNASIHAMRLKSVVCAPIRGAAGVLGALYLDHRFQRGLFGPDDVELLLGFADQVAIALTNARLHAELALRTQELLRERQRIEALLRGQDAQIERLTEEVRARQEALEHRYDYSQILGRSAAIKALFRTLDRVIDTPATVLIQGESGTGKELIARAIHFNGPRKAGPFVSINCGALPETLLESELFGAVRGAFTGATRDRAGLFVSARGGTLFLDELGEMPLGMQVKLLRVLQEREVQPLGSDTTVPIDVRIVCATNRRLRDEVAAGRFREDLYYRVGVVEIVVPPLRERVEDIPEIAARIVADAAATVGRPAPRIGAPALRALLAHPWRGNVRELENVLTKAVVMTEGATIQAADVELPTPSSIAKLAALPADRAGFLDDERARILGVLRACRWNVSEAGKALGIPRATLYRKLDRFGATRERSDDGAPARKGPSPRRSR
jgi:transcriptional regulator with GAF, ATPase, and Fis domain/tetratricopeptide (TPR) repeat protein